MDNRAKAEVFMDELKEYQENKLEQVQRQEVFYILENFYEQ